MRTDLRVLALGLVLLLLHVLVMASLRGGSGPDLVLVFALAMGMRSGSPRGLMFAFGLGLCVDVLSGSPFGLYALLRGTACAATRIFDRALYLRAPLPWAIYVAGYTFLDGLLLGLTLRLLAPEATVAWVAILLEVPLTALLTALAAIPVLALVRRWEAETQRDGAWMSLTSRARP